MRAVRRVACVLVVLGAAGLLVAGCGIRDDRGTPAPATPVTPEEGDATMFSVGSSAFTDGGTIPVKYCQPGVSGGQNISVPLEWTGAPEGTKSFVIAMIDRHRVAQDFVHWVVVDLPASTTVVPEGASGSNMPPGSRELAGTSRGIGYRGPQPPPGSGDHDYEITVYALDTESLVIGDKPSATDIERAITGKVLAAATITGYFGR